MNDVTLRERMAHEVQAYDPMPDLVAGTVRRGRATRRRRRLATGALVGVGAIGATAAAAVAPSWLDSRATDKSSPADQTGEPIAHVVSDPQYRNAIRSTLADLLPARYGDVEVREGAAPDGADRFLTTGAVQVVMTFTVDGMPDDEAIVDLVDCAIMELGPAYCRESRFDGWLAVSANRENPGDHYALVTLNDWDLNATLMISSTSFDRLPTLDEEQAILRAPQFLDLVRLGVEYASDRTSRNQYCTGDDGCAPMPRPRWLH